jgi:hypothetical protein
MQNKSNIKVFYFTDWIEKHPKIIKKKFVENVNDFGRTVDKILEYALKFALYDSDNIRPYYEYVNASFYWESAIHPYSKNKPRQNYNFWEKIDKEWRDFCEKVEREYGKENVIINYCKDKEIDSDGKLKFIGFNENLGFSKVQRIQKIKI